MRKRAILPCTTSKGGGAACESASWMMTNLRHVDIETLMPLQSLQIPCPISTRIVSGDIAVQLNPYYLILTLLV